MRQTRRKIRKATLHDLDAIKIIADTHRHELGFVLRAVLEKAINNGEIIVANISNNIVGFAQYHHRLDGQTTLHIIAVSTDYHGLGLGKAMFQALCKETAQKGQRVISLKCPINLDANRFYFHLGFRCIGSENGKLRDLNIWRKRVN